MSRNQSNHSTARKRGKSKSKKKKSKVPQLREAETALDFLVFACAGCSRCGSFLSGYRAIVGNESVQRAAEKSYENWVYFDWSTDVQKLMSKLYGIEFGQDSLYDEFQCTDCTRLFTIRYDEPTDLSVEREPTAWPETLLAPPVPDEEESGYALFDYRAVLDDVPNMNLFPQRSAEIKMQFSPHYSENH